METERVSTIIRLRPGIMAQAKRRAKQKNISFNAYVEQVLDRESRVEWPVLPPDFKVSEEIKKMQCIPADWKPSKEELEADPRLAHIWEECGYEA
jgi:hypothetical protein